MVIGCGANVWIISLCPIAHFDAFAIGSLLAICVRETKVGMKISALGLIGLAGIVVCIWQISRVNGGSLIDAYQMLSSSKNYLNHWLSGNIYLFISLLTTGIVGLLIIHDEKKTNKVSRLGKVFVRLGDDSYVLYLFHWPIHVFLEKLTKHWGMLFLGTLVVSVATGFIFNLIYTKLQKIVGG